MFPVTFQLGQVVVRRNDGTYGRVVGIVIDRRDSSGDRILVRWGTASALEEPANIAPAPLAESS